MKWKCFNLRVSDWKGGLCQLNLSQLKRIQQDRCFFLFFWNRECLPLLVSSFLKIYHRKETTLFAGSVPKHQYWIGLKPKWVAINRV